MTCWLLHKERERVCVIMCLCACLHMCTHLYLSRLAGMYLCRSPQKKFSYIQAMKTNSEGGYLFCTLEEIYRLHCYSLVQLVSSCLGTQRQR